MKKALLASTAIVAAAAIASPANAADRIKLSLGGYMEQYIGFADNEDDTGVRKFATFDQQNDNEIYFSGSTTLDNGIKLAVRVELEGDTSASGNDIDEAWLDIQTDWGSVRLGQEDPMNDIQAVEPSSGISDDYNNWVPAVGVNGVTNDDSYSVGSSGDDNSIHYLSPSIAGFQAGVSYTPEAGANGDAMPNRVVNASSAVAATLNYSGKFAEVGLDAGYGYYHEGHAAASATANSGFVSHNVGLNLTYAGFGIGGNYGRFIDGGTNVANLDQHMYQVGVWYSSGPMALGFLHKQQQNEGGLNGTASAGREDESTLNSVWFNYTISDGVRWESMVFNVDYDNEDGVDANSNDGGWGVVGGLRLDF